MTASLALQAVGGLTASPWLLLVVAGYVGSFICLARILALGMPVGVAYGIWAAAGVVLTTVLAHFLFGGPLSALMGVGIALIVFGVVAVEIGSQQAQDRRRHTTDDQEGRTA